VGVGLATAVKLTPGVFVVYLLVTRRTRAAVVASVTAAAATGLVAAVSPDTARIFFTAALADTGRVGVLGFVSNQSLQGLVARLDPRAPSGVLWAALVAVVAAVWLVRVRRAARAGDDVAGVALTGVLGCLLSPVTWVHHLVWLIPALVLLVDRGLAASGRARWRLLVAAAAAYCVLCSRIVWHVGHDPSGVALLGADASRLVALGLLVYLPVGRPAAAVRVPVPRPARRALLADPA
jgi:alpha-1,2-mannosyltransferase